MQELSKGVIAPDAGSMAGIQTWAPLMAQSIDDLLPFMWEDQAAMDDTETDNLVEGTMGYRADQDYQKYVWTGSGWKTISTGVIPLTSSDNLNNITEFGIYECNNNNQATKQNNYPIAISGFLEVIATGNRILQRYTGERNRQGVTFVRYWWSGASWGEWRPAANDIDFINMAGVNAINFPFRGMTALMSGENRTMIYTGSSWIEAGTYMPGEKYIFNAGNDQITYPGMLTSGNKSISFSVFLPKKIRSGGSFSIQQLWVNVRGGTGGYWSVGDYIAGGYSTAFNGITRSVYGAYENVASIRLDRSTNFFSTNNMPVSVDVSRIELTFT